MLGRERSPALPDIATAQEQGLSGVVAYGWNAIFLPKSTPAPIVTKLNAAVLAAMDKPAVQQRVSELGASLPPADHRTPQYLQTFVESEIRIWGGAVKAAGITAE